MRNNNILLFFFLICVSISFSQVPQESTSNDVVSSTNVLSNEEGFLDDFYLGTDLADEATPETESPALSLLRVLIITGILGFLTWLTLKFFFKRNALSLSTAGNSIEVLATIPAGLGSYFLIAKLSNLYYLFSLSPEGLRLLDKITDLEAIDFIELNKAQTLPEDVKFVDLLEHLPEGKPKKALEFLREKINQLKNK